MKLAARTIPEFLKAPDRQSKGVLIYGPDEGLVRERAAAAIKALGDAERVELAEDALKADPALLADALSALSLLGGRQAIVLRAQADAAMAKIIAQALEVVSQPHYLLVLAGDIGPRSALRQLFEGDAALAALPCYKDEAADIGALVRAMLAEAGVRLGADAMEYLVAQLGNDRAVSRSEVEKLVLYAGDAKSLTLEDVQALVGGNRDVSLDALAQAVAGGDYAVLDAQLAQAWREGMQPVAVLRAVIRYFQRLYQARSAMAEGKTAEAAVAALKPAVFFRQVPIFTRQVQQWNQTDIAKALARCNEAEAACKTTASAPTLLAAHALTAIAGRGKTLLRN